jgi:hypothetical protein
MGRKKINTTNIGCVTLVGVMDKKYPIDWGNCFGLIGEDNQEYRIVNFVYENLKWALEHKKISFPIRIEILHEGIALIDDIRIPSNWYREEYCTVCCPDELLTEPQKMEIERQKERGERTEIMAKDELPNGKRVIIIHFDISKQPKWS